MNLSAEGEFKLIIEFLTNLKSIYLVCRYSYYHSREEKTI